MSKSLQSYQCIDCKHEVSQWVGKCPECGQWNSIVERNEISNNTVSNSDELKICNSTDVVDEKNQYIQTSLNELNYALGGGISVGSVILLSGQPGIGKSTLALQMTSAFTSKGYNVLYVSGEESVGQVIKRVKRLGLVDENLHIQHETCWEQICVGIEKIGADCVVIDSIQTTYSQEYGGKAGSELQVKSVSNEIVQYCKSIGITCVITGQITKMGNIAGPKFFEHIVDVVVYFEGLRSDTKRKLSCHKNRFGPTNQAGYFILSDKGIIDNTHFVEQLNVTQKSPKVGVAQSLLCENSKNRVVIIESLVRQKISNQTIRSKEYVDLPRLILLLALLDKYSEFKEETYELYLNAIGSYNGYKKLSDVAVLVSIWSAYKKCKIDNKTVFLGEVSLSGDIFHYEIAKDELTYLNQIGIKQIVGNVEDCDNFNVYRIRNINELFEQSKRVQFINDESANN